MSDNISFRFFKLIFTSYVSEAADVLLWIGVHGVGSDDVGLTYVVSPVDITLVSSIAISVLAGSLLVGSSDDFSTIGFSLK